MIAAHVAGWVQAHPLSPSDVDCATTVMLKILDGKCKMTSVDKIVMEALYDAVREKPGLRFGDGFHALIAEARHESNEALRNVIYEKRVLAETELSRPVMKAFKAMIRAEGLFAGLALLAGYFLGLKLRCLTHRAGPLTQAKKGKSGYADPQCFAAIGTLIALNP